MVLLADFAWSHCDEQGKVFVTNKPIHFLQGEVWLHLLKSKIFPQETKISPWNLLSLCYGHKSSWNGCTRSVWSCSSWHGPASAILSLGWFSPPSCTGERKKRKISGGFHFIFLIPALKISGLKTFNTGYCMCCPVVPRAWLYKRRLSKSSFAW